MQLFIFVLTLCAFAEHCHMESLASSKENVANCGAQCLKSAKCVAFSFENEACKLQETQTADSVATKSCIQDSSSHGNSTFSFHNPLTGEESSPIIIIISLFIALAIFFVLIFWCCKQPPSVIKEKIEMRKARSKAKKYAKLSLEDDGKQQNNPTPRFTIGEEDMEFSDESDDDFEFMADAAKAAQKAAEKEKEPEENGFSPVPMQVVNVLLDKEEEDDDGAEEIPDGGATEGSRPEAEETPEEVYDQTVKADFEEQSI